MKDFLYKMILKSQLVRWYYERQATALIETVLLFPVLISMLMGTYDLGQGIAINQKTIGASQIIGDLVARERSITFSSLQDIVVAGELALEPYDTTSFGYDIASVEFDADGNPVVLWRVTENMPENDDAIESTEGLGTEGEGVVVVSSVYKYKPYFTHFVVNEINMKEVAFLRGRRSSTVLCSDCPS